MLSCKILNFDNNQNNLIQIICNFQRLLEAMDHTAAVLTNIESGNASQAQEFSSKFVEAIEVRSLCETPSSPLCSLAIFPSLNRNVSLFCSEGISDTPTRSSKQAASNNTLRVGYLCSQTRSSGSGM